MKNIDGDLQQEVLYQINHCAEEFIEIYKVEGGARNLRQTLIPLRSSLGV